jgi:predicted RNA-binding protein with RPS1 domain
MLFEGGETGLLHISELSKSFVHNFTGYVQAGNIYKVRVLERDEAKKTMKVSLRQVSSAERRKPLPKKKIPPAEVSFAELERLLPMWIREENQKESV